jgi:hypothetical protein
MGRRWPTSTTRRSRAVEQGLMLSGAGAELHRHGERGRRAQHRLSPQCRSASAVQRTGLWLERNRAIEYFANVSGPAHRMRPVGDLQMTVDRRRIMQIALGGGSLSPLVLPERWVKPVVKSVIVPAHAAASPATTTTTTRKDRIACGRPPEGLTREKIKVWPTPFVARSLLKVFPEHVKSRLHFVRSPTIPVLDHVSPVGRNIAPERPR